MRNFILAVSIAFVSCHNQHTGLKGELKNMTNDELQAKYDACLTNITSATRKTSLDKIPALMETCLVDSIFEYWYDTEWDFNGVTQEPRKGKIACGYFVTTTLKHLGLNIERAFLAQQASSVLIKEICDESSIKIFTNSNHKKMLEHVSKYDGNIFIIGLDNHVGFIVRQNSDLFFIHASGLSPQLVIKEKANEAHQLEWSKYHMVGHLNFKNWAKGLKSSVNSN